MGKKLNPNVKKAIPENQKASIRQRLKMMIEDGIQGAEDGLEWHERLLKAESRKRKAKKKARKRARASRKKNR